MRPKLIPTPKLFGSPKTIEEANQITSSRELNTIICWICRIKGFHKSGNPFNGSYHIRPTNDLFSAVNDLKDNGFTIISTIFTPITLRDLHTKS